MATPTENSSPSWIAGNPGTHHVKCHPEYFELVMVGDKNFEVRWNDRGYRNGDLIVIHEWDPVLGAARVEDGYTKRSMKGTISCVLGSAESQGIKEGYVVLGVSWWFPSKGA